MGLWPLKCFGGQNWDKTNLTGDEKKLEAVGGWDDRVVGEHMFNSGIEPVDTRERCGAERFLPYLPELMPWAIETEEWFRQQSYNQEVGLGCCSREPIYFHGANLKHVNFFYVFHNRVETMCKLV